MASRFYQLKSGHALTGVYLKRPDDHCWWCDPENISGTRQTRPPVQALLQVGGPAGHDAGEGQGGQRGGSRSGVGDLLVDFLRSTHVGRTAPPVEENWDSEEEAEVEEMGDGEEQAE